MAKTLADLEKEIAQTKEALAQVRGSDCEVYARIVGYYRAVRNWNKGKRREFDERKMFAPDFSAPRVDDPVASPASTEISPSFDDGAPTQVAADSLAAQETHTCNGTVCYFGKPPADGGLLFSDKPTKKSASRKSTPQSAATLHYELYTKRTCPNCPPVKNFMSHLKIAGLSIDVDTKAGLTQASENGVFSSPTVIFYDKDNRETARYHSVDELKRDFAA